MSEPNPRIEAFKRRVDADLAPIRNLMDEDVPIAGPVDQAKET